MNRIDRIVPFEPLGRAEVAAIAEKLIADLFRREGLAHRRCVLAVDPAAMERIVAKGYHPELGARALKREVERQLTAPIAARLAALTPDAPTVVSIYPSRAGVAPHVRPLLHVDPVAPPAGPGTAAEVDALLTAVEEYVNGVEAGAAGGISGGWRVSTDALSADDYRYFAVREQIARIDRMVQQIDQAVARQPNPHRRGPRVRPQRRLRRLAPGADGVGALLTAGDVHGRLAELLGNAEELGDSPEARAVELLSECALLEAMTAPRGAAAAADDERALLHLRPVGDVGEWPTLTELRDAYLHLFPKSTGFSAAVVDAGGGGDGLFVLLEMPAIARVVAAEDGIHLFYEAGGNVILVQARARALAAGEAAAAAATGQLAARAEWRARLAAGRVAPEADPHPLGRVVRVYDADRATLDLRSGLLCDGLPRGDDLRRFILASLPVPGVLRRTPTP